MSMHTNLHGVWLASVYGHAHSEATEYGRVGAIQGCLLSTLSMLQDLGWPGQGQQAMLHIQGPSNGIYGVVESHGEGITLSSHLHANNVSTLTDKAAVLPQ